MAQVDTPRAYEIIRDMMENADKDAVRLAAARTVIQIAGVPLTPDSNDGASPSPNPSQSPQPATPTSNLLAIVKPQSPSSGGEGN
jgi:hypothetical protein